MPSFDVKAVQLQTGQQAPQMHVWVFRSNTGCPELNVSGGFGLQPGDTWGSMEGNKGCWGAKLSYDFTFVNTTSDGKTYSGQAWLSAQYAPPRQPGDPPLPYWTGGCCVEAPTGYTQGQMLPLQMYADSVVGELTVDSALGQDRPVSVAPGGSVPVRVSLMTGGDSSLPVILQVVNTLDAYPNQGGGD